MNENEIILQNPEDGMSKTLQIRNSTIDFLVFTKQNSQDSIEVRVHDENVWLTQDGIARLFDKGRSTIAEHLQTVFKEGELNEDSVCRNFRQTAADGKTYNTKFYNLDAIISVGSTQRVSIIAEMLSQQGIFSRMCRTNCTGQFINILRPNS